MYMPYEAQKFDHLLGTPGFSDTLLNNHFTLYQGYVKNTNTLLEEKNILEKEEKTNIPSYAELTRRFGWEFNGMRLHELYFAQFEGGATAPNQNSALASATAEKYGESGLIAHVREVAGTRGIGWVIVYADQTVKTLHTVFVNDHEVGGLAGLPILLALDLWEHAYMVDYVPAEKKNYIDAFFANLNWGVVEKRFEATR